jgi:hypothetical protein
MGFTKHPNPTRPADAPVHRKNLASGPTQNEFCKQESLFKSTFSYWLRHYRKYQNSVPTGHSRLLSFIPIEIKVISRMVTR